MHIHMVEIVPRTDWAGGGAAFLSKDNLDVAHFITLCLLSCLCLHAARTWTVCVCAPREGIQWEAIDWMDNAECLDLIEKVTKAPPARMC